jgi:hypothetical protein
MQTQTQHQTRFTSGPQNNFNKKKGEQPSDQQPSKSEQRQQDLVELRGRANFAQRAVAKVAGFATGLGLAVSGLITNACAGGAHGVVRGADLTTDKAKQGLFQTMFVVNLAAAGFATGHAAQAALINVFQGEAVYHTQPDEMKQNTQATAEQWTDGVKQYIPGSDATGAKKVLNRIGGAVAGEVVGAGAGALVGVSQGFPTGMQIGERAVLRKLVGEKPSGD